MILEDLFYRIYISVNWFYVDPILCYFRIEMNSTDVYDGGSIYDNNTFNVSLIFHYIICKDVIYSFCGQHNYILQKTII